jgi:hypothetical protein
MRIPTLYQFFRHQVSRGFAARGLNEPATIEYVSDVLARFAETRSLYGATDSQGQSLEYIVDFLSAVRDDESRRDRARGRSLLRHLGEYTLFMSGLFRERLKARGELNYYMQQGTSAYAQCADIEPQQMQRQVFRRVQRDFVHIADTLDHMRERQFTLSLPANTDNMIKAFWRT